MTLKSGHHRCCQFIIMPIDFNTIAIKRQHRLQCFYGLTAITVLKKPPTARIGRFNEVPDTIFKK